MFIVWNIRMLHICPVKIKGTSFLRSHFDQWLEEITIKMFDCRSCLKIPCWFYIEFRTRVIFSVLRMTLQAQRVNRLPQVKPQRGRWYATRKLWNLMVSCLSKQIVIHRDPTYKFDTKSTEHFKTKSWLWRFWLCNVLVVPVGQDTFSESWFL